jgi:hypothetical protein
MKGTKGSDVLTRTRDHEKAEAQPLERKSPRPKLALCARLSRSSGSIYNGLAALAGSYFEGAECGGRCEPISGAADDGVESPCVVSG